MFYPLIRKILFQFDPEVVHHWTLRMIGLAGDIPPIATLLRWVYRTPSHPVHLFGLTFANPVGLAAGYDKDATAWRGLACLGFGHIEVGTVTLYPQSGNPKPRLFRIPEAKAVINRMGFPGQGAYFVAQNLKSRKPKGLIIGVNLGKNKDTPNEEAAKDYIALMEIFSPLADYLVINVSSPNTLGLRQLQARLALDELLQQLIAKRTALSTTHKYTPLLVKLAPDLNDNELDDALDVLLANRIDGVIATNTTIQREGVFPAGLSNHPLLKQNGGLSGEPLFALSLRMVQKIIKRVGETLPVIGVGGITRPAQAHQMLDAGAKLIQVYTGLIYNGPAFAKDIVTSLVYQ